MERCPKCFSELTTGGCPQCTQTIIGSFVTVEKKPYKCPVCDGNGDTQKPPHVAGDQWQWSCGNSGPYPCKACSGTGVVWG